MRTWLPIVDRELRATARRSKTYWLRLSAALAAFLICIWVCLWTGRAQPPAMIGKALFSALSVLAFGYCLLVGPFITADAVSEEKREGTLGLLFLTDLTSLDVVLGKWVATGLAGFFGLLAILPALGLPLLLGGVTPDEYLRVALAVVNAILFSLTAGMFVSTLSREQTKAVLGSVVLILGVSGLAPGLFTVIASGFFTKPMNDLPAVALISPAYTGYLALDTVFKAKGGAHNYWLSLGLVHGFCWLFMLVTAVLVPRVWRESPDEKPTTRRWFWRFGYTSGWRRRFARRLEKNPVFALAARPQWPPVVFWCLVSLVAINVYWLTYGYRRSPASYQFHIYFSHALVFTNRVWIAAMACRFMLEARRTGALELMLTSPLPVRTLLRGHWRALRRLCFLPVLAIALLHVFYVWGSRQPTTAGAMPSAISTRFYVISAAGSLVSFLADVMALCWMGTWLSLASRKANLAILKTFAYVILIPWAIGYFMPTYQFTFAGGVMAYYLVRPACWVLKNAFFVAWAAYKLKRHFRPAAAQTYRWRVWPRLRRFLPGRARRTTPGALAVAGEGTGGG